MGWISTGQEDGVRTLRLERSPVAGAAALGELLDAVGEAAGDSGVRALVLVGPAEEFTAAAGLADGPSHPEGPRRRELLGAVLEALATSSTPSFAAVGGPCRDGGAELAAACAVRVADVTASFRFAGVAHACPAGAAELVALVGLGAARDLLLTARTVLAEEAARLGLVEHLVPDGAALATARELAGMVAAHDPAAIAHLQRLLGRFFQVPDRAGAQADALRALGEAGGDHAAVTPPDGVGAWAGGHRQGR